jgi:anthranilate synthase/aminodeoxychorismate synthase-like glutamine amidotransferase
MEPDKGEAVILLIDNHDSFTYNLFHYLAELGAQVRVFKNDEITLDGIKRLRPEKIVISPGPCTPKEAGISCAVISRFAQLTPILGVCLGHQCIGAAFGGEIIRGGRIMEGKLSDVYHDSQTIYDSLRNPFSGMRYHSLVVNPDRLPPDLSVSAHTPESLTLSADRGQ